MATIEIIDHIPGHSMTLGVAIDGTPVGRLRYQHEGARHWWAHIDDPRGGGLYWSSPAFTGSAALAALKESYAELRAELGETDLPAWRDRCTCQRAEEGQWAGLPICWLGGCCNLNGCPECFPEN